MKKHYKIILLLIFLTLTSCLNEEENSLINFELEDSAKLVQHVESIGDFPNSTSAPALVLASDLYLNINDYWIVDIRDSEEFAQGHLESALNVVHSELKRVVDSLNLLIPFKRIVIVSKNGQSSSYFTCILRIAGYTNVYSLNYGMASWNIVFSDEWLQALGTSGNIFSYNNDNYPKNDLHSLPKINFPSGLNTLKDKINYRLEKILEDGFKEDNVFVRSLETENQGTYYLICYGKGRLYFAPMFVQLGTLGHPPNTVWYSSNPLFEFRSTRDLQTLPNNTEILIYSGDGQLSACMVAYLRFLGYDAKTLLFGANQLFYPRMQDDPELFEELFSSDDIMYYPYVTGK
jgi:rhodanese-related sulfurtransferase